MAMLIPLSLGQQTGAVRTLFAKAMNGARRAAAPRSRKRTPARPKRRKAKAASSRPARLVKGSAAAKRYMASIRKKRRR